MKEEASSFRDSTEQEDNSRSSSLEIYHERQSPFNLQCLKHAINHLLGGPYINRNDLDAICEELSPPGIDSNSLFFTNWKMNPHRSVVPGLGNYDVNVAMVALQRQGYEARFFDTRKSVDELIKTLCGPSAEESKKEPQPNSTKGTKESASSLFQGLLLNVPGKLSFMTSSSRHWICYRRHHLQWWKLDSNEHGAIRIHDIAETLQNHLLQEDHIILIVEKKLEKDHTRG